MNTTPLALIDDLRRRIAYVHTAPVPQGVPTGLARLDAQIGGLLPGRLYAIGAPTGGRMAAGLARQIADVQLRTPAGNGPRPVWFFSLHTPAQEIVLLLACHRSALNPMRVRAGLLSQEAAATLETHLEALARAAWRIEDDPALSVPALTAQAAAWSEAEGPPALIVVDSLPALMTLQNEPSEARAADTVVSLLRHMARELGVPVLLTFDLETDEDTNRPRFADWARYGHLRRWADGLLLLCRLRFYAEGADLLQPNRRIYLQLLQHPLGLSCRLELDYQPELQLFVDEAAETADRR